MSAVHISLIRQRMRDVLIGIGLREALNPYDRFEAAPNIIANQLFSIGMLDSNGFAEDRQRPAEGIRSETNCSIKISYRINPHDQLLSYDAGFDTTDDAIKSITNRAAPLYTNTQIRFVRSQNNLTDSGEYLIFTIQFAISHYIPLQ
jgi:hypothetical protein